MPVDLSFYIPTYGLNVVSKSRVKRNYVLLILDAAGIVNSTHACARTHPIKRWAILKSFH